MISVFTVRNIFPSTSRDEINCKGLREAFSEDTTTAVVTCPSGPNNSFNVFRCCNDDAGASHSVGLHRFLLAGILQFFGQMN